MTGAILLAVIQTFSKPADRQTRSLAGLLVLLLVHCLGELFTYSGAYQYAPSLAGAELPLRVLLGPALFFYAHATMSPQHAIPAKYYKLALAGPLMVIVAMLPFVLSLDAQQKLALADPSTRDPDHFKLALFACSTGTLLFLGFTAVYLGAALRLHQQHRTQLMARFSSIEKRSMDWFRGILLMWGSAWLLYAIEFSAGAFGWHWFGSGLVLPLLESVILVAFIHLALRQPVLTQEDKDIPAAQQPRSPTLSEPRMKEIAEKLVLAMQKDKVFLNEALSLNQLSKDISVSENHISETLSQYLKSNFFHFVNGYRIEAAKRLLRTTSNPVTSIAFEVGFNSKSTFNAAFRKSVGTTPTAFRNHMTTTETQNFVS